MKSWRTTTYGVATVFVALGSAIVALVDGKPETTVNVETTLAAITAGIGLIFARDNQVTSEQALGLGKSEVRSPKSE